MPPAVEATSRLPPASNVAMAVSMPMAFSACDEGLLPTVTQESPAGAALSANHQEPPSAWAKVEVVAVMLLKIRQVVATKAVAAVVVVFYQLQHRMLLHLALIV